MMKVWLLALSLLAHAESSTPFVDTCQEGTLESQRKSAEAKATPEKRLLIFESLAKELVALYRLKNFPKDYPKAYVLNCLKVKNKILNTHVAFGGAPFRGRAQYSLLMGELEESRKNMKAALVYYDRARVQLPEDPEVAFKAADVWILTQISQQSGRNLKADRQNPEWVKLENEFLERFGGLQKIASASAAQKSRAETALGRFYEGAGEKLQAKSHYEAALKWDPKNAQAEDFLKGLKP